MLEWIISASVLIVVVIISRQLLRGRVRCWVQYSLWLLVALRLLVPVSPVESVFSVANLLPESRTEQETEVASQQNAEGAAHGIWMDKNKESFREEVTGTSTTAVTVPAADLAERDVAAQSGFSWKEVVDNPLEDSTIGGKDGIAVQPLMVLWLAGICFLALWLVTVNGIFRRKVRKNRQALEISEQLRIQLQNNSARWRPGHVSQKEKTRLLPVYVTDQVHIPCMYGLLHPAIYVTSRIVEDPEVFAMVLRHEQMHYYHKDHFWAVVRALCLCIHWYNPLVWAAVRLSRQDGELACDEGVLRQLGEGSRSTYGEALLALSTEQRPKPGMSMNLATSMSGSKKQLKERLSALVKAPQMAVGTAVLVMAFSLCLAACTFTGRQQEESEGNTVAGNADIAGERRKEAGNDGNSGENMADETTAGSDSNGINDEDAAGKDAMRGTDSTAEESAYEDSGALERELADYGAPWIFAEEYTGYLDECMAITWSGMTWHDIYSDQDYDGDGRTDRIYQDVESEPGVMKMRVEFGNGEILAFDTYMNSPLVVQSMDLDGDGSLELLFTKPNEFSTNPMGIATDILLFTRQEDSYRQVEIALEEVAEEYRVTPLVADLMLSYTKADDTHIRVNWKVPGAEGDLGKIQEILRPADEDTMEYYRSSFGQRSYTPAYDGELIQERYAFLRLYFEGLDRSGDYIFVDMTLENGKLSPISSCYVYWNSEEMYGRVLEEQESVSGSWNAQIVDSIDKEGNPVAEVSERVGNGLVEGETEEVVTRKLTYVETEWSLSAAEVQFSDDILYWACQALQELEQWTGTELTEVCYCVTDFGEYVFARTPEDMQHSRSFYSRCYGSQAGGRDSIQSINYSTDMDVWYSPIKQYTMPPDYDKMTMEELLIWFFERSAIAQGSRVKAIVMPWEGDYILRTDQDTYYEYMVADTVQKGISLYGPYDSYPQH